ncbi:MAG TPA: GAF domain-containing protein, partial [Herpetosiphonaceae bacterium]
LSETTVLVEDWPRETRFPQPPLLRGHGVISSLRTTIHAPSRLFGILGADSTTCRAFTPDDADLLRSVANLLALSIDRVEAQQTVEQRVRERTRAIERRHQVAASLREILTILNSNHTLDDLLDQLSAQACRLLGAAAGAIYRLDSHAAMLNIRGVYGLPPSDGALNLPVAWGVAGQAVRERQPAAISDTRVLLSGQDHRAPAPHGEARLTMLANRYRAQLVVPLIIKADVYGALVLYYGEPRTFSDEDVQLAVAFSDQAVLAIENARLIVAAQGKAILQERQRLARDLHDSVAQALYSVILHAEAATRVLPLGDDATVADYLREMQTTAQDALAEMRLLIFELRPTVLDQEGLVAALAARLEAVEERANLQTEFTVAGVGRLPPVVEQAVYRIAQEALNNVLKHAHATRICVALRQEPTCIMLEIIDDGVGFDPVSARTRGGWGLRGIEERVAQHGGRLTLHSAPGGGTQVRVEIGI